MYRHIYSYINFKCVNFLPFVISAFLFVRLKSEVKIAINQGEVKNEKKNKIYSNLHDRFSFFIRKEGEY
jgi:hypothetical protein